MAARRFARRVLRGVSWTGHPENVAVLRIAVTAIVLAAPEVQDAVHWAELPASLRTHLSPGFVFDRIPITADLARAALRLLQVSAAFGLVGCCTRFALPIAAVAAFYVLMIPQRYGAPLHAHHLVWLLAIVAAAPSGDALSVDAMIRGARAVGRPGGRAPRAAFAYAIPLWVAWAQIGMVFFFPGVWKLCGAGLAWIASDNLRNQMYWKWFQFGGWTPTVRIDRVPILCRLGAGSVVAFELGFAALIFTRYRIAAVGAALAFHSATALFMRLYFWSLWGTYVMFLDWRNVFSSVGAGVRREPVLVRYAPDHSLRHRAIEALRAVDVSGRVIWAREPARGGSVYPVWSRTRRAPSAWPSILVGAALIVGNGYAGVRGLRAGWPFACYPTFEHLAGDEIPALLIEAMTAEGTVTELPGPATLDAARSQRLWGLTWDLIGSQGRTVERHKLESYWGSIADHPVVREKSRGATRIRFFRASYSVMPEHFGRPPLRKELLLELRP